MRTKNLLLALALTLSGFANGEDAIRLDKAAVRLDGKTSAGFPLYGTGTSGRLALWTGTSALGSDSGLTFSGTGATFHLQLGTGAVGLLEPAAGVLKVTDGSTGYGSAYASSYESRATSFNYGAFNYNGFHTNAGGQVTWTNVNNQWTTGVDTGMGRASGGLAKITSGASTTLGSLQLGNLTATALATPGSITVAPQGTGGVVTWTYVLVARLGDGTTTQAGAASSTAVGNATLDGTNFNRLSWSAVTNAADYVVYRTVAGTTPATTGIIYTGAALTVDDKALAGGGQTAPTRNVTGRLVAAKANVSGLSAFANNAAALAGGLVAGDLYMVTGSDPRAVSVVY